MQLSEYAKIINKLCEEYPEAEMVYSVDDEGNEFRRVEIAPVEGYFYEEEGVFGFETEVNAVCVN